MGKEVLLALG